MFLSPDFPQILRLILKIRANMYRERLSGYSQQFQSPLVFRLVCIFLHPPLQPTQKLSGKTYSQYQFLGADP